MSRHVGLSQRVHAADQLQRAAATSTAPQPLPPGQGGRAQPDSVGITDASPITFLIAGDVGGVADPNPQIAVAKAMAARAATTPTPAFVYIVGDIVYFWGDEAQYGPQFYEPYAYLQLPIVAIPGNHDGDTGDDPSRAPLDGFMANFCAPSPVLPTGLEEYGRDLQTQPYCDWTLQLHELTIIGLYSNVPDGGHLAASQISWLTDELRAAASDRPLIVTLHHPPYSVDAFHGGSQRMGHALDGVFSASGRVPELIISGHVHDYQRFTRTWNASRSAYIVMGNSGYHNLHAVADGTTAGEAVNDEVTFDYGDQSNWGFLELTVAGGTITGSYTAVTRDGHVAPAADTFTLAKRLD